MLHNSINESALMILQQPTVEMQTPTTAADGKDLPTSEWEIA